VDQSHPLSRTLVILEDDRKLYPDYLPVGKNRGILFVEFNVARFETGAFSRDLSVFRHLEEYKGRDEYLLVRDVLHEPITETLDPTGFVLGGQKVSEIGQDRLKAAESPD
jgi:hypothetical protein